MGCQKRVAETIIEGKCDYVLSLKGNQGTLHKLVQDCFEQAEKENFPAKVYVRPESRVYVRCTGPP